VISAAILIGIFVVIGGMWLACHKLFQLIDKTYITKSKESEGAYIYWVDRVWAVSYMISGLLSFLGGLMVFQDASSRALQGTVPDPVFYLIYLTGLSGVYWLAKNNYKEALVYAGTLAIHLAVTALFSIFGSSLAIFKLGVMFLILLAYVTAARKWLEYFRALKLG
jgi:hypothetical protein